MRGLPPELLFVLLFIGVVLFQYLTRRRPGRGSQEPLQEGPDAEDDWALEEAAPVAWSPPDVSFQPPAPARAPATSPASRHRRFSRQALMGTRRDVQNAVVIATILGPCRALEPPPSEDAASSPRPALRSGHGPQGA